MILQLQHQTGGSLRQICRALQPPRSSFYRAGRPSARGHQDERMGGLIEEIFKRHRRRYGYPRIQQELGDRATVCAPSRLRRLMRQRGLRALQPKNYLPKPVTAGQTVPRPICWRGSLHRHGLTRLGLGTSPSSPPARAGFTSR